MILNFDEIECTCDLIFRSIVINDDPPLNARRPSQFVSLYSCTFALNALLLFLNCFADSEPVHYDPLISEQAKPSPYFAASVPSRLTFGYVTRLIWTGYRDVKCRLHKMTHFIMVHAHYISLELVEKLACTFEA